MAHSLLRLSSVICSIGTTAQPSLTQFSWELVILGFTVGCPAPQWERAFWLGVFSVPSLCRFCHHDSERQKAMHSYTPRRQLWSAATSVIFKTSAIENLADTYVRLKLAKAVCLNIIFVQILCMTKYWCLNCLLYRAEKTEVLSEDLLQVSCGTTVCVH